MGAPGDRASSAPCPEPIPRIGFRSGWGLLRVRIMAPPEVSDPRQSLRAVVGNLHAGDFAKRAIRLSGVAHKPRGIPVDLIQKCSVRRDPVVARAAGNVTAEPPGRAIAPNFRARGILGDTDFAAVEAKAAD